MILYRKRKKYNGFKKCINGSYFINSDYCWLASACGGSGIKKTKTEVTKIEQTTSANNGKPSAPSINNKLPAPQKLISRTDAVSSEQRVRLENEKLTGSISLNGALIDDVVLKTYKETLDKNSKQVVILNPKKIEHWILLGEWLGVVQINLKVT
jgi:hypothetical protein